MSASHLRMGHGARHLDHDRQWMKIVECSWARPPRANRMTARERETYAFAVRRLFSWYTTRRDMTFVSTFSNTSALYRSGWFSSSSRLFSGHDDCKTKEKEETPKPTQRCRKSFLFLFLQMADLHSRDLGRPLSPWFADMQARTGVGGCWDGNRVWCAHPHIVAHPTGSACMLSCSWRRVSFDWLQCVDETKFVPNLQTFSC